MDLSKEELEQVYLALSRKTHPDAHPHATTEEQVQILSRSAEINDAYKLLKDPWRRAVAILELHQPGIMEDTKKLDPDFLMEAMEQAEAVAQCAEADRRALIEKLKKQIVLCQAQITTAIQEGRDREAAVLLHQARYHRKACHDLQEGVSL